MGPVVFSQVATLAFPTLSLGRQLYWSVDDFSAEEFWFTPNGYSQQLTVGKSMWDIEFGIGKSWGQGWGGDRGELIFCLLSTTSYTHSGYTVHLGKHALGRVENGEQAMEVVRSIPHPEYQVSPTHLNHDHDIMLLELKSPVQLSSRVHTLQLSADDCLPTGTCCRVSGWGTTTSPQGKCLRGLLESSQMPEETGSHKRRGFFYYIFGFVLCAGFVLYWYWFYVCVLKGFVCVCRGGLKRGQKANCRIPILSSQHLSSGNQAQVLRLDCKHHCLLSHLASPKLTL